MNRTLVCVICQTRSWDLTWKGFKKYILDELNADLALSISVPDDYNYQNPFWQHAKYKTTFAEYEDWSVAFDYAQNIEINYKQENKTNWRKLLEISAEKWLGGVKDQYKEQSGSGAIPLFAKWSLLQLIKNENLFSKYDRIIITRSDYMHSVPHPNPALLDPRFIWIPDGEGYGGLTDRHAVLSMFNFKKYLNLLSDIVVNTDNLYQDMIGQHWNTEKFLKTQLLKHKQQIKCYPYHSYIVRQRNDHTNWIKGSYQTEHGHYIKNNQEYVASTCLTPYAVSQEYWNNIINRENPNNCFNAYVLTASNNYITYDNSTDTYVEATPDSNPPFVLTLDCKDAKGELFMSSNVPGIFERITVDKIIITESNAEYFIMETFDTREKIFMNNNYLSKGHEIGGNLVFKISNRYSKVVT